MVETHILCLSQVEEIPKPLVSKPRSSTTVSLHCHPGASASTMCFCFFFLVECWSFLGTPATSRHQPLCAPFWSLNDFRWPKPGTDGLGSPGCKKHNFSNVPSSFCPVILMICSFFLEKVMQYRWIRPLPSSNLIWLWKILENHHV